MYSKLDTNEEIRAYQPEHVKELVSYFQKRGLNISCFKDLFKSVYIVRIENVVDKIEAKIYEITKN